MIVFTECGQIQFSAAVDTGAKPNDCDQARADDVPIPRASASGVHVRAVPGCKSGTNRITQHHPTSTNINKRLYRWMAVSATKALVGIVSAALHQQPHYCPDFIQRCGYANYVKWYLGIDDEHDEETKGRYKFPYGDFERVHRCGLLAAESRAGRQQYYDIELAVAHLHGMLDALTKTT